MFASSLFFLILCNTRFKTNWMFDPVQGVFSNSEERAFLATQDFIVTEERGPPNLLKLTEAQT